MRRPKGFGPVRLLGGSGSAWCATVRRFRPGLVHRALLVRPSSDLLGAVAAQVPARSLRPELLAALGRGALAAARSVGVPAFAADWLMGAIKPALASLDRSEYLAVRSGLLGTLATRQLRLGQDAIIDALVSEHQVAAWREAAVRFPARWYLIECICSDEVIHRERIEGRIRGTPVARGWLGLCRADARRILSPDCGSADCRCDGARGGQPQPCPELHLGMSSTGTRPTPPKPDPVMTARPDALLRPALTPSPATDHARCRNARPHPTRRRHPPPSPRWHRRPTSRRRAARRTNRLEFRAVDTARRGGDAQQLRHARAPRAGQARSSPSRRLVPPPDHRLSAVRRGRDRDEMTG